MTSQVSSRDDFCFFTFFDCFATKGSQTTSSQDTHKGMHDGSNNTKIRQTNNAEDVTLQRETTVHYQQPHLVEPMKLRVYADLPNTPLTPPSSFSAWPRFSRSMTASRTSSRASLFSLRKKPSSPSISISKPFPASHSTSDLPLRQRQRRDFRPLQLSIYNERNRLSDLPEFDRLSFTEFGDLRDSAKVLSRPQSAVLPLARDAKQSVLDNSPKPVSMYQFDGKSFSRPQTSGSIISMSRPPSEYDALHSHPVSWATLPGLSISTQNLKTEKPVAILTPMEEEFPSETNVVTVDGIDLKFPVADPVVDGRMLAALDVAAPAPTISRGSYLPKKTFHSMEDLAVLHSDNGYKPRQSLGQWLINRQRTTSTSTIGSTSTTKSFAEHRRKRSEFYLLGQDNPVTTSEPQRTPNLFDKLLIGSAHKRNTTNSTVASTIATVDTEVLSYGLTNRASGDTFTTASIYGMRSRAGTVKSISSPGGRKATTSTIKELGLSPPMRGEVFVVDEENTYLDEIRGRMQTQGVGIAF